MRTFDVTYDYNRETFSSFLYDFLPDDFEPKEEEVFFDFKNIERGFKLGTCKSLNLDVFEFKTRPNRDARVTLTREAVTCMKKFGNPNALVAFYSSKSHNWRFSLITTDYTIEKGKIKTEYSNPKRFSFKLGYEAKAHTPTVMLFNKGKINEHLENGKTVPVLEDLKSRFALEVVSKEFFDEYKVFYEDFVQYITGNRYLPKAKEKTSIHKENKEIFEQFLKLADGDYDLACKYVRDYIKKMMGRLVFLEYLQKKGWLGVEQNGKWGDGDKNFLLSIFEESNSKDDFLDKVLEPLFFGMLNTPEDVRQLEFKHNRWNIKLLEQFKKVPYLNGGLFEKDELDKLNIVFPKEMFSNPECIDIQRVFAGVQKKYPYTESCGLLDFFARYNFTIDETDPTDMEIGVEPEMLGKIFENLLEDNKDKGAFYTPKEIVQYMCRESLIAYLGDNEKVRSLVIEHNADFNDLEKSKLIKKLKAVKVCDPAVGSGAFPMGILNELFACRVALGDDKKATEIKKQIVRENIYGVDIEKGAVDIARLRFWLAIIVDEKEPIPLPNLDYKIMQGNSLLESYEGIELSKLCEKVEGDLFDDADDISALIEYLKVYYDKHEEKNAIRDAIKASVLDLLKNRGISGKAFNELSKIDLHENNKFFLWHTWFNDVFNRPNNCNGFDIVIGNPPYVESRNSCFSETLKDALQHQIETLYSKEERKCFSRGADLLIFFFELSFRLLNSAGINTFITENSWLSTDYGKEFQHYLLNNMDVRGIIDSDYKYFETADINTVISFIKRKTSITNAVHFFHCHENLEMHPCNTAIPNQNDSTIDFNIIPSNSNLLNKYKWGFLFSTDIKLITLLERMCKLQNKKIAKKISIGQGLNITKDKILSKKGRDKIPFFISDNGAAYCWNTITNSFVSKTIASSTRKIPLMILPRGLGTHFCCMNEVGGYSASYVEIYENEKLTEEEKLKIWIFCNSSLLWLLREYTGRCNLGGGMLKAEATDLKSLPLCFDFENISEMKSIYKDAKTQTVSGKIEEAIMSNVHKRIDRIVFDYFKLPHEKNFIIDMLIERFNWRGQKSRKK